MEHRISGIDARKLEKQRAREVLSDVLKPGDTVVTKMRHRAAHGAYCAFDVLLMSAGEPAKDITKLVSLVTGMRFDKNFSALGVGGLGNDAEAFVVRRLAGILFKDENALGQESLKCS